MACEVCEHCDTVVMAGEGTVHEGHSYHQRCYKCYVCEETNLRNAEIFKGVIFCYKCSDRIFKNLSPAKKPKKKRSQNRVLEMCANCNIKNSSNKLKELPSKISSKETAVTNKTYSKSNETTELKKTSNEMGTTTLVTQELLKHFQTPHREEHSASSKPRKKRKHYIKEKTKDICSDLRIAELGKSTEIAHMMLRKSEIPVIVKSHSQDQVTNSSHKTAVSEISEDGLLNGYDSYYSKQFKTRCIDRRIGSILKLPYISFKKNILERSSLISVFIREERKGCIIRNLKKIFNEEFTEHQRRGLKKIFSTINRSKDPYRLGWLHKSKIKENMRSIEYSTKSFKLMRCKHYDRSHSYRCMRSHVMKRAGPTTSQLAVLRKKIKNFFFFDFIQNIFNYSEFDYAT